MAKWVGLTGSRVVRVTSALLGVVLMFAAANIARADWWSENFELHGKANSTVYFNSPSLSNDIQMDQWMNTVEMNFDVKLYQDSDLGVSFHGIVTPTYDAVYDIYPHCFGDRRRSGSSNGTAPANANGTAADASNAMNGSKFPGHGCGIKGGFYDEPAATSNLFTGKQNPQFIFDNTVFFGNLGAASRSRGDTQPFLGGNSTLSSWDAAYNQRTIDGVAPAFLASIDLARGTGVNPMTPIHSFGGDFFIGDRSSIGDQAPYGINHTDGQLKTRCFDGVHDWCWAREAYFEAKYQDTQVRLGRQQIVWGKTDAFRLQDLVNPIDFSSHNVYPSLEDRRIPSLAVDLVQSFGTVGPLEDFSLELVWVVDRFKPVQVGQCGDFWAFTAACEGRADVGAHGLLNLSVGKVDERKWQLKNTEPGFRFEFRIPDPSIAFSLSGFWGIQDAPVARFVNHYSATNPNPAMMLFLQAQGIPASIIPVFNVYDQASVNTANATALATWGALAGGCRAIDPSDAAVAACIGGNNTFFGGLPFDFQPLGWIWSSSQAELEYPRTFTLGGSLDYQIPGVDTVLRMESAYDFNRAINNTNEYDGISHSDVLMAAVGLDRSFFIPILNKDRTAFVSFQTFVEHIMTYDGNNTRGMTAYENSVVSTFFIENYWRNDSIVLTTFAAYDWSARAWITGPKLKWVMNDRISFEVGVNLLQGSKHVHNIRDICSNGTLSCVEAPATWNDGNWQLINKGFARNAESPFYGFESFADTMMESRDEIWTGVTYQF